MPKTTAEELRARVRRWREGPLPLPAALPTPAPSQAEPVAADRAMSRGQFLRFGGAAAAGAVVAGAAGVLSPSPAGAATGQAVIAGVTNAATSTAETTSLVNPSVSQLSTTVMRANNVSNAGPPIPAARIAAAAITAGIDNTGLPRVGMWAETDLLSKSIGVVGRAGPGIDPLVATASLTTGVLGTAVDGGTGVVGAANGTTAWGVQGRSNSGIGVVGSADTGISLWAAAGGRLLQTVRAAGAPAAGTFFKGEQIRDANGELWLCVADGSPGTWRRAATVRDGYAGGAVNLLSKPIRLLDTRSGPPLAPGASLDLQVTGVTVGGVSVPAGALAVIGNITVTQTQGANGYLTLYAQGSPPDPATSNANWFGPNQDISASAVAGLNTANGRLTLHNGMAGGSNPTHLVFDATGFVA